MILSMEHNFNTTKKEESFGKIFYEIPPETSIKDIQNQYSISLKAAIVAKNNGFLFLDYDFEKITEEATHLNLEEESFIEEELRQDFTDTRRRIYIDRALSTKQLQELYGISQSTAWRARTKTGFIFLNYQKRVINEDHEWAKNNIEMLLNDATDGAHYAMRKLTLQMYELGIFDFEDVKMAGYLRLIELCGDTENRDCKNWRIAVAKNGALSFLKKYIIREDKRKGELPTNETQDWPVENFEESE